MAVSNDPTIWTDEQREFYAEGWNACLRMQPGALGRIIKFCNECSDPQGWLATNVRHTAQAAIRNSSLESREGTP